MASKYLTFSEAVAKKSPISSTELILPMKELLKHFLLQ